MSKLTVAGVELRSKYILAPLAGYTSYAMRKISNEYGVGMTYTEMISSSALVYDSKKTMSMLPKKKEETPVALQLFGGDKETVLKSIEIVEKNAIYDFLDFNIGCPVPKVYKQGAGSSWLAKEDELIDLVREMVKISSKPVIAKIRLGIDSNHLNYLSVAKRLEEAGIKMLVVHGRTRKEMFQGRVHYDLIKEIKDNLTIPVIANGDIGLDNIEEVKNITGADGYMIGRNAIGNPQIFTNLVNLEEGKELVKKDYFTQEELILKHLRYLIDEMGDEKKASEVMRGIACFYLKGIENAKSVKMGLVKCSSYKEFEDCLKGGESNVTRCEIK